MSREDAHKILDKVLDAGFCGEIKLNCFRGTVASASLEQSVKNANEVMMVVPQ